MNSGVRVVESCLVTPCEETPRKGLWLSPLDLVLANRGHTPTVNVYFHSSGDAAIAGDFFDVARLKESLAKALVAFYPLAGRLGVDSDGRIEINCNGEGVLFVVAHSDHDLAGFSDPKPSPELRKLFVPPVEPSFILAIQVTFLKAGGVVLGTAQHHAAVDGSSFNHFFQTWASYCRDGEGAVVELPCHDRTLLRSRVPPIIHPETIPMLCCELTMQETSGMSASPVSTEVLGISGDQLAALKRLCGGASTFCAVSALVWHCVCVARRLDLEAQTRMNFPVCIRRRVRPPLPDGYFGNTVVNVFATAVVKDIVSETLASTASRIKGTTERLDGDLLRSAVDYLETAGKGRRPEDKGNLPQTELRMNSWLRMPMYADFGWGKPRAATRAEAVRGGWVYLLSGRGDGSGGARVQISLEAENLKTFQRSMYAKLPNARL